MLDLEKAKEERGNGGSGLLWHFPVLDHGEEDGLADPLLEYFEGNHEWYIAREAIQNSLDARLDPEKPVLVVFEKINFPQKNVPGIEELKFHMQACLKQISEIDEKAKSYFEKALSILNQDFMPILKIGDFNTLGLDGSDNDKTGRWFRLVRSIGVNKMTGAGGGSFGIGKGAPIIASSIRTVLYSTFNENEHVFQGKTRLITHEFNGKEYRGAGFFGIDGYKSVRDPSLIPRGFSRDAQGTDVYIIAYYSKHEDWRQELAKSILENFWFSIYSGDLEVKLIDDNDEVKIHAKTLLENLTKYSSDDALFYYKAVTDPERSEKKQLATLGNCKLFIRKGESYPKSIAFMRKPKMVVKKKKFRILHDNFAGVFLCDDDKGNLILREMEPPQHDEWSWERHPNQKLSKKADFEINEWIKETLRNMDNVDMGDPEDIPELDRFLPYEDNSISYSGSTNMQPSTDTFLEESPEEIGAERSEIEDEVEDFVQRPKIIQRTSGNESGFSGTRGNGKGDNSGKSGGIEDGNSISLINTSNLQFRIISLKNGSAIEYCLIIDPLTDQKGAVNIVGVGDDANYPVPLSYANSWDGKVKYNITSSFITNLELYKGKKQKIKVGLLSNKKYALGLENYEG